MYPQTINPLEEYELADDFHNLDTVKWTSVDDSSTGTNTANAVAGGQISIVTAASANDYHYLKQTAASFKIVTKKPLWFASRFTYTEANVNASALILGVSSVVTGALMADGLADLIANFSGALFYKVGSSLVLRFCTSNTTTQTKNTSLVTMVSGQTYQAGFHWDTGDGTTSYVTPWVYDETAATRTVGAPQSVLLSGLGTMQTIFGVKSGGAAETLKLDYVRTAQKR